MSTATFLQMIAVTEMTFGGERVQVGEGLTVSVPTASELQRSGRARLIDPADLALIIEHRPKRRRARHRGTFGQTR